MDPRQMDEHLRLVREAANNNSRLLKLPAELRNRIWSLVVPVDESITPSRSLDIYETSMNPNADQKVVLDSSRRGKRYRESSKSRSILLVCRQIHNEASNLLYSANIFQIGIGGSDYVDKIDLTNKWLQALTHNSLDHLRWLLLLEFDLDYKSTCRRKYRNTRSILIDLREQTAKALRCNDAERKLFTETQNDVQLVSKTGILNTLGSRGEWGASQLLEVVEHFAVHKCKKLRPFEI